MTAVEDYAVLEELQERIFTTLDTLPFAQRAIAAHDLLVAESAEPWWLNA